MEATADTASTEIRETSRRAIAITALILTLASVGVTMLVCLVIRPAAEHVHIWRMPPDVWVPLRPARYVADGAVFRLYEVADPRNGWPYTPGLPMLLAFVPWIGDHFGLLGDLVYPQRHPQMFLLLGPATAFVGSLPLLLVGGRAVQPSSRARTITAQILIFVAMSWASVVYLHAEDTIAVACLVGACLAAGRGNWRAAGAWIAVGLLFKQWVLWPALPIVAAAPRRQRSIVGFYAFGIPALVMLPFVLSTPSAVWHALTSPLEAARLGHAQLWYLAGAQRAAEVHATLPRIVWGVVAVFVAVRVRRRADTDTLLAAVGVIMLARLAFEPVIFAYYLMPAVVVAIVWCARNGRPIVLRSLAGFVLGAFCVPHTFPEPVFWLVIVAGLAYVCGPIVRSVWTAATARQDDGAESGKSPAFASAGSG
jgi:hypothetical protein